MVRRNYRKVNENSFNQVRNQLSPEQPKGYTSVGKYYQF